MTGSSHGDVVGEVRTGPADDRTQSRAADRWDALDRVHRRVQGTVERRLREETGFGVSDVQALRHMKRSFAADAGAEPMRLGDVADGLGLSQSATSRLMARLRRRGLIISSAVDHDRRGVQVLLTPAGHAALRRTASRYEQIVEEAVRDLDSQDADPLLWRYLAGENDARTVIR
ncbi:DNA-binding MarR family transcriptional regulator [Streptomyces sp. SAI-208]|jgi:DNA-binding MarR family transcriptional regulator|uniref:MarR family winged helix-turn-helix transcriptional regulator n=1 Tax=unclassified Streptomyces TaxID=2593676 RepID=UPI002475B16F|nr:MULTISPECIES: MarR family winged helix-turn-helix transcriptional regulator [unclassified Streptomyces]MDH6553745.1 DNA-binding MarR family transcriptional regulator [Streptomyces sp. SAI-041]MDH6572824.1 DNA-binding MarR family transcriptional regulator [Streptomyces sp. SAI-117]MDH6582214.1 DNA-binding MarR family transcriptional regulator [Streptomyces sp. SAI-133]MDH6612527.1 DNA-binding MarR family transcriptional regulator [Streptomyces sp. SAI-208]